MEHIEFDERETEIMLKSENYADFPVSIKNKFWYYNYSELYECIPRNLRFLFDKE